MAVLGTGEQPEDREGRMPGKVCRCPIPCSVPSHLQPRVGQQGPGGWKEPGQRWLSLKSQPWREQRICSCSRHSFLRQGNQDWLRVSYSQTQEHRAPARSSRCPCFKAEGTKVQRASQIRPPGHKASRQAAPPEPCLRLNRGFLPQGHSPSMWRSWEGSPGKPRAPSTHCQLLSPLPGVPVRVPSLLPSCLGAAPG